MQRASVVDQLIRRNPEVANEGGDAQYVRPALGHENAHKLFPRIDVPGRAEGAVEAKDVDAWVPFYPER